MNACGCFFSSRVMLVCVVKTLMSGVWLEGDGEGDAWPTEMWEGLDLLWLLLFWSSSLSGTGDGVSCADGKALWTGSALTVAALDVSMTTEGGDKWSAPAFRF